ncbi:MAG: metal-dependent hydrolase [Acidobacteriota bacterium]
MPTIFSHAILASALGGAFQSGQPTKLSGRFWILTAICAIVPDLDVVGFAFQIQYGDMFGHRGLTHSLSFALLVGLITPYIFFSAEHVLRRKLIIYFAAVTFTHPLLDMLTNGGLGVALLAPFGNERFFSAWRPIEVSPIGSDFFSERGIYVLISEIAWIWLPSLVIAFMAMLVWRKRMKTQPADISRT